MRVSGSMMAGRFPWQAIDQDVRRWARKMDHRRRWIDTLQPKAETRPAALLDATPPNIDGARKRRR